MGRLLFEPSAAARKRMAKTIEGSRRSQNSHVRFVGPPLPKETEMGRRERSGRTKMKDVVGARLAKINPAASAIERVVIKAELILDAFIEAGEIPIGLRRREDSGDGTNAYLERIINRILGSVEAVVTIPFEDEDPGTD